MVKKIPKILKLIFVLIFVFQLIGLAVLFALPEIAHAADPIIFKPQISIPGFQTEANNANMYGNDESGYTIGGNSIGILIKSIYKYAIGIVGILATIVMMIGGFMWLIAGGNQSKISEAQEWIKASLTGLVLALGSYMILATVNPALTTFKSLEITPVSELGCCTYTENGSNIQSSLSENECKKKTDSSFNKATCKSTENSTLLSSTSCPAGYKACQQGNETGCTKNGTDSLGHDIFCKKNSTNTTATIPTTDPSGAQTSTCDNPVSTTDKSSCTTSSGGTGYCLNQVCNTCKTTGATCTGSLNYDYECCSGDCEGVFSYACK